MTTKEAIEIIKIAQAEVEWEFPLDYALAFEIAIQALQGRINDPEMGRTCDCTWCPYYEDDDAYTEKCIECIKNHMPKEKKNEVNM